MNPRHVFFLLLLGWFPSLLSALTFDGWRASNFTSAQLSDATISGAIADPDADGAVNFQEYVFYGSPLTSEANLQPKLELISGTLALTYRERQGMSDVNICLQGSDTLMNWITYNTVTEAERVSHTGYDEVTLLDPVAFNGSKRFLRLNLQLTPVPALSAPSQLSLTVDTPTAWTVSWTDPNTTEVGYAVESQDKTTGAWNRLVTLGADTGTWQNTTANYQTSTTYRVVAIGADSTELPSAPITLPDSDGDGIPNAFELGASYAGLPGTYDSDPNQFSTNGSGVSDGWLAANGFDPATHDSSVDTDGDGLSDAEEYAMGTDPHKADTDGDGVPDALDGWPLVAWLHPAPLPEVRYALVRLTPLGLTVDPAWLRLDVSFELSDAGDVLCYSNFHGFDSRLLKVGANAPVTVPVLLALDENQPLAAYVAWQNRDGNSAQTVIGGALGVPYDYPGSTKRMSRDGHIAGYAVDQGILRAVALKPDQGVIYANFPDALRPAGKSTGIYLSQALAVNNRGDIATYESGLWTPPSPYSVHWLGDVYTSGVLQLQGQPAQAPGGFISGSQWSNYGRSYLPGEQTFIPLLLNDDGLAAGYIRQADESYPSDSTLPVPAIYADGQITPLPTGTILNAITTARATDGLPAVVFGVNSSRNTITWSHRDAVANNPASPWLTEDVRIWNGTKLVALLPGGWSGPAQNVRSNDRLEIVTGGTVLRNGVGKSISQLSPGGWTWQPYSFDINNQGMIVGSATRTLDDQGQPVVSPTSEPVLLIPIEIDAQDRLLRGSVTIPEGWTNYTLSFRHKGTNQDLGTYANLEPGATTTVKIYDSPDDFFSEAELTQEQSGTLPANVINQKVVFARDPANPRKLSFATVCDELGDVEITISFGSGTTPATAVADVTLTANAPLSDFIDTMDERITSLEVPAATSPAVDLDGDGIPDSGDTGELIQASQAGTLTHPGAPLNSDLKADPANLVLRLNDDNDDGGPPGQRDDRDTIIGANDNDIVRLLLKRPATLATNTGTLTLTVSAPAAVRLYRSDGQALLGSYTVNLASPSGDLAGLATGSVPVFVEGLAETADVVFTMTYSDATNTVTATDSVHLRVAGAATLARLNLFDGASLVATGAPRVGRMKVYEDNGAQVWKTLTFSPIGTNPPVQNRGLLAKMLFLLPSGARTGVQVQLAWVKGFADGFWVALKGEKETVVGVYTFFRDHPIDRSAALCSAVYGAVVDVSHKTPAEIRDMLSGMTTQITKGLYTSAEQALPWAPITTGGVSPDVVFYMYGFAGGTVTEGVAISALGVGVITKVTQSVKAILATSKTAAVVLDGMNAVRMATGKLTREFGKWAVSQEGMAELGSIVSDLKTYKPNPANPKFGVELIEERFLDKTTLLEDYGKIFNTHVDDAVMATRGRVALHNLAELIEKMGTDLTDDGIRGFAYLQKKLVKTGEETTSRWADCEKLFGGLDTSAKRQALNESLVAYKTAVELDPEAKFWLKNFSDVSSEAYHYTPNLKRLEGVGSFQLSVYQDERGWYVTTSRFDEIGEAAGKLQLPELENARYRIKFSTSEAEGHLKLPKGFQNTESHFEPVTRDFPDLGPGSAPQMLLENKSVSVLEVYDTVAGRNLTNSEIQDLINL